jgi:L-ascorbate metabolism protein UlaG (beta-lactamase superfamily)
MKFFLLFLLLMLIVLLLAGALVLNQPAMGGLPTGARLAKVQASPNYRDGEFQNLSPTPERTNGATVPSMLSDMLFNPAKRVTPQGPLPSVKTDLKQLDRGQNTWIWLGHASYLMVLDGRTYLIDPVLSGRASPVPGTVASFAGTDIYEVDDLPPIDVLLITHDHWDHIDYPVIQALKGKVGRVITGLGTGEHFVRWGYDEALITELDWNDSLELAPGTRLTATPARHFSGRGLTRNQALWLSFVLHTPTARVFLGGDSGFDSHYKAIGDQHGPFDLAILENGQYNKSWALIHAMPEETAQASRDVKAKSVIPVHWGKFRLSLHDWDEPIERLIKARVEGDPTLLTPMIGEPVFIGKSQAFRAWWRDVK